MSEATREAVNAVAAVIRTGVHYATNAQLAEHLKIDKSSASRRVRVALEKGYLRNDEDRRGKPSRLALADPLPDDVEILPTSEALRECCSLAVDSEPPKTPTDVDDGLVRFEQLLEQKRHE